MLLVTTDTSIMYGMKGIVRYHFLQSMTLREYVYLVGVHLYKLDNITVEFPGQYFDWVNDEAIPPVNV
jgi:hypothetical protein